MKIKLSLPMISLFIVGILSLAVFGTGNTAHRTAALDLSKAAQVQTGIDLLKDQNFYKDLPVSNLKVDSAPNSWATAIYIPQIHRSPGSEINDQINDKAVVAQKQIYDILEKINKTGLVKIGMVEGEMKGDIAIQKKQTLKTKINVHNALLAAYQKIKTDLEKNTVNSNLQSSIFQQVEAILAQSEREIYLDGGLLKLWAGNDNISLVGSENPDTVEASKILVRDHIYLQDRLTALANNQNQPSLVASTGLASAPVNTTARLPGSLLNQQGMSLPGTQLSPTTMMLLQLLNRNSRPQFSINDGLQSLKNVAVSRGDQTLSKDLSQFVQAWSTFNQNQNVTGVQAANNAPSRATNPYINNNNTAELKQLLAKNEEKIQETVVNQRNKETADNLVKSLKEHDANTAVIQFGAGHETGLIKELNDHGITVITVMAEAVQN